MPLARPGGGEVQGGLRGNGRAAAVGYLVLEDPPTVALLRLPGRAGSLKWLDVRNYGVSGWPAVMETFGRKDDSDPGEGKPLPWRRSWAAGRAECLAALAEGLQRILVEEKLGTMQATAGSQALYSFKRRHYRGGLWVHVHEKALRLERDAYHGGRCEAFVIGAVRGPVYNCDVRSMYPWVCWHNEMPVRLYGYTEDQEVMGQVRSAGRWGMIAEVTVEVPSASYPACRLIGSDGTPKPLLLGEAQPACAAGARVIYPTGRIRLCLCGPELQDAIDKNIVVAWHRMSWYDMAPVFAGYMASLVSVRKAAERNGDKAVAEWAKRLAVSLPGKLGQHGRYWKMDPLALPHAPYGEWYSFGPDGTRRRHRAIAWRGQTEVEEGETAESIPAVAAWICSLGRLRLLEGLRAAGRNNVYYCDTDSLILRREGWESLLVKGLADADSEGHFRLLGEHKRLVVHGTKHYRLDDVLKCSGLSRRGIVDAPVEGEVWLREWVAQAVKAAQRPEASARKVKATRAAPYLLGQVLPGGKVVPWELKDE